MNFLKKISLNLFSIVLAVLGIFLACYFYFQGKEYPLLNFYENPAKATLINIGEVSNIKISVEGHGDVKQLTASQIAIWNSGSKSIKRSNVLEPFILYLPDGIDIIDATIKKTSRDIINFKVEPDFNKDIILISWDILEKDDGAIIQVLHTGNITSETMIGGIIEGQKDINIFEFKKVTSSSPQVVQRRNEQLELDARILLSLGCFCSLLCLYMYFSSAKHTIEKVSLIVVGIVMLCFGIGIFFWISSEIPPQGPPFGF